MFYKMGSSCSGYVQPNSGPPNMLCMYIASSDTLKFLYLPHQFGPVLTDLIDKSACWSKGIQSSGEDEGTWKIKFRGNPWASIWSDFVEARKLLLCAIETLSCFGWTPIVSTDLARIGRQGASVYFVPRPGFVNGQPSSDPDALVCLALHRSDYIVVVPGQRITAPERANITVAVSDSIKRVWKSGIQDERAEVGCKMFKLRGNPWHANGEETVRTRVLVMNLLQTMNYLGYELLAGVDASTIDQGDVSSLIFRHVPVPWLRPHIALSLNMSDRLRLITNNEDEAKALKPVVHRAILKGWARGIQTERKYDVSHEWQMNGNPWFCDGTDTVDARRLVLHLFEELEAAGWHVSGSLDLSRKITDKSTFFFEPSRSEAPPSFVACIGLHSQDVMRLVNCPQDLVVAITEAVALGWSAGVQQVNEYGGAHQIKLKGSPWSAWGPSQALTRHLMAHVLSAVLRCGWTVVSSADLSAKTSGGDNPHKLDVDSWFLKRAPLAFAAQQQNNQSNYSSPGSLYGDVLLSSPAAAVEGYASQNNARGSGNYAPQSGYALPQPGYAPQQSGYASPHSGYVSPQSGYASPQSGYVSLQSGYAPQQPGYVPRPQPQQPFSPDFAAQSYSGQGAVVYGSYSSTASAPPPAYEAVVSDVYAVEKNSGYVS